MPPVGSSVTRLRVAKAWVENQNPTRATSGRGKVTSPFTCYVHFQNMSLLSLYTLFRSEGSQDDAVLILFPS